MKCQITVKNKKMPTTNKPEPKVTSSNVLFCSTNQSKTSKIFCLQLYEIEKSIKSSLWNEQKFCILLENLI